jgi:hypothetical protein
MPKLIAALTTSLLSILATFIAFITIPSTWPYRTHLLIAFSVLLIGYMIAGLVWVAIRINITDAWQILTTCRKKA